MATGHRYSGINVLILGMHPVAYISDDPRFCTYLQAQDHAHRMLGRSGVDTAICGNPLSLFL